MTSQRESSPAARPHLRLSDVVLRLGDELVGRGEARANEVDVVEARQVAAVVDRVGDVEEAVEEHKGVRAPADALARGARLIVAALRGKARARPREAQHREREARGDLCEAEPLVAQPRRRVVDEEEGALELGEERGGRRGVGALAQRGDGLVEDVARVVDRRLVRGGARGRATKERAGELAEQRHLRRRDGRAVLGEGRDGVGGAPRGDLQ